MSKNGKLRILKELEFIEKYSDEFNPVSAADIIKYLESEGIIVERKALYDDIQSLIDAGYDICKIHTPKRGYALLSRDFEMSEIYLLTDAVQSAGFISTGKSKELVEKLESLLSKSQAEQIKKQVFINNRIKTQNEEVYYVIDALNEAMIENKKVSFNYIKHGFDNGKLIQISTERKVSPYAIFWSNDHYYLICNNEKYDNLLHLRIDKIKRVKKTSEQSRHFSEVSEYKTIFDVADYAKKCANMFGGELEKITLCCDEDIIDQIMDKFGANINIKCNENGKFTFDTYALISDGLLGWILQFRSKVKVIAPQHLQDSMKATVKELKKMYN